MLNRLRSSSLKSGVTIVATASTDDDFPHGAFRLVCEHDVIKGEHHLGLGKPTKKSSSLWTGPVDELAPLRQLYRDELIHQRPAVSVISMGDSEGNWLQGPGFLALTKHLDGENGLITIFYESSGLPPVESANLGKLREMAKAQAATL